ncbi:hypothetical protein MP228_001181 [Amoeboaphelidium protococcarum]|nr:hypothetical protein MP228_001181 [Amoeboaphelidium protococcarum]
MSGKLKTVLKKAKDALTVKDYKEARSQAEEAMRMDTTNYQAIVFYALACDNLNLDKDSEEFYQKAIKLQPEFPVAWQGLVSLYEKSNQTEKLLSSYDKLTKIFITQNESRKFVEIVIKQADRLADGRDRDNAIEVLKRLLPGSEDYHLLKLENVEDCPSASQIWRKLIQWRESGDQEAIQKEVNSRKFRLGAPPLSQIRAEVEKIVYNASDLNEMYAALLELVEVGSLEEQQLHVKLCESLMRKLPYADLEDKQDVRNDINQLVEMIMSSTFPLEPLIVEYCLESQDVSRVADYNIQVVQKYCEKFPSRQLAQGFLSFIKFMHAAGDNLADERTELLKLMQDLNKSYKDSMCVPLLLIEMLLQYKDFNGVLVLVKQAKQLLESKRVNERSFYPRIERRLNLTMARCYVQNGSSTETELFEAVSICEGLLKQFSNDLEAVLLLIDAMERLKEFEKMLDLVQRVLAVDQNNYRLRAKLSWALFNLGQYQPALEQLLSLPEEMKSSAEYYYRLGLIYWHMDETHKSDKEKCFNMFVKAVQIDSTYSDAFTYLGHYYAEIAGDMSRAKKCYQKSVTGSSVSEDVGIKLARLYEEEGDTDSAISVYEAVIESNNRSVTAWKSLGYIQYRKEKYNDAAIAFQCALRVDSGNCELWSMLGRCYQNLNRYIAALKVYGRVMQLSEKSFVAMYGIAVCRWKLFSFQEALEWFDAALDISGNTQTQVVCVAKAQCLLEYGKDLMNDGLRHRAIEAFISAGEILLPVLDAQPGLITVWRLLHDLFNLLQIDILPERRDQLLTSFNTVVGQNLPGLCDASLFCIDQALELAYQCNSRKLIAQMLQLKARVNLNSQGHNNSLQLLKQVVCVDGENSSAWNGLARASSESNLAVALHSLVTAIEIASVTASTYWFNLALYYYYVQSDIRKAGKALSFAQALDPLLAPIWFLTAHLKLSETTVDTLNLYRHACQLSVLPKYHQTMSFGIELYLHDHFLQEDGEFCLYLIERILKQKPRDYQMLLLQGLLHLRMSQYEAAMHSFRKAQKFAPDNDIQFANSCDSSLAKCLLESAEDLTEAVSLYKALLKRKTTKETVIGLALSLYHSGSQDEAVVYIDQFLGQVDGLLKAKAILLKAQMLFSAHDGTQSNLKARDCLFMCYQQNPSFLEAIKILLALGLVSKDKELSQAALMELKSIPFESMTDQDLLHLSLLKVEYSIDSQSVSDGVKYLLSYAHLHPDNAQIWYTFSKLYLNGVLQADSHIDTAIAHSQLCLSGNDTHDGVLQSVYIRSCLNVPHSDPSYGIEMMRLVHKYPHRLDVLCYLLVALAKRAEESIKERDIPAATDAISKIDIFLSLIKATNEQSQKDRALTAWLQIFEANLMNNKFLCDLVSSDDLIASLQQLDELNSTLGADTPTSVKAQGYIVLARCLMSVDACDQAMDCYNQAIKLSPLNQWISIEKQNQQKSIK